MDNLTVWTVILCLAVGSFSLRFVFTGLIGDRELPEWVLRHLRYTAVGILPGLVAPLVLFPAATGGSPDAPRITAAGVTLVVGYFTKNLLLAIICGAISLYLGLYLLG